MGLALRWIFPAATRGLAIGTQSFALLGTLVGIWVTAIGIGPSTAPDIAFHVAILITLIVGLFVAVRAGRTDEPARVTALALVRAIARASFLLQLGLGLALWAGFLRAAVPLHMANGLLFVLLLEVQTVAGAFAGVSWGLVAVAALWGAVVVVFGLAQGTILPGDLHWVVQAAHLGVGLVAMGLAERVARAARSRLLQPPAAMRRGPLGRAAV